MKIHIVPILLLSLLCAPIAKADCAAGGLYFWPKGTQICEKQVFMVEGYANTQEIVTELGKNYLVFLKSDQERIALKVREVLKGQFSLTQAILVPEQQLKKGTEYHIVIEQLNSNEQVPSFESEPWTVDLAPDEHAPDWLNKPAYESGSLVHYGCGPSIHAIFTFKSSEKQEYLALVRLTDQKTGLSCDYYIRPNDNGKIAVGHGMCSGAFTLEDGNQFTVQFSLMDGAGNKSEWSEKIDFERPI